VVDDNLFILFTLLTTGKITSALQRPEPLAQHFVDLDILVMIEAETLTTQLTTTIDRQAGATWSPYGLL
jgi:hypothetical protein